MRADRRRLFQHADVEVGFQLLQVNGACKTRRSCTNDADVIFHDIPFNCGCAHLGCIRMAPSRRMVSPFNMGISKIAATSCANSSGLPRRLGNGIWLARDACNSGVMPSTIGVWKMPGAIAMQRTPIRASSRAMGRTIPARPAFVAEYAACPIWPSYAATDAVWTSKPRSPSAVGVLFCMMFAAALSHRNVPIRLMCTTLEKKSPAMGPFLPSTRPAPTTPAQLTRRLSPPIRDAAVSIVELTSASDVTSHRRKLTLAPNFAAVACPGPSWTSTMTTLPPLEATWLATAAPRPDAPPVTTARATSIFIMAPQNRPSGFVEPGPQVNHTVHGVGNRLLAGDIPIDPPRQCVDGKGTLQRLHRRSRVDGMGSSTVCGTGRLTPCP